MTGVSKSSSLFRRKLRNQVLKNKSFIRLFSKHYGFEQMDYSDYKFLNDIHMAIIKINQRAGRVGKDGRFEMAVRTPSFYGPKDYLWENDTEYYFFQLHQSRLRALNIRASSQMAG